MFRKIDAHLAVLTEDVDEVAALAEEIRRGTARLLDGSPGIHKLDLEAAHLTDLEAATAAVQLGRLPEEIGLTRNGQRLQMELPFE